MGRVNPIPRSAGERVRISTDGSWGCFRDGKREDRVIESRGIFRRVKIAKVGKDGFPSTKRAVRVDGDVSRDIAREGSGLGRKGREVSRKADVNNIIFHKESMMKLIGHSMHRTIVAEEILKRER